MSCDTIREGMVTTRKPHRCVWCDEMIETGKRAMSHASTVDGDFHSGHMHPECWAAWPFAEKDCDGMVWFEGEASRGTTADPLSIERAIAAAEGGG